MAGTKLPPSSPLRQIVQSWTKKIEAGLKYKKPFSDDAREAMNFFDGPTNWMWSDAYSRGERGYNSNIAPPAFRVQINKVFELVDIFGSVIYHRNPVRTVNVTKYPIVNPATLNLQPPAPGMMPDPQTQQMMAMMQATDQMEGVKQSAAQLLEGYLNWTPDELDLKRQSRRVVDEALIKGAGVFWTELVSIQASDDPNQKPLKMIGSFYDTIDNLVIDPDFDNPDDMLWCAKRCVHPVEEVARMYGLSPDDFKNHLDQNQTIKADNEPRSNKQKPGGKTNQLCVYWKIWSKTGLGDRLKDAPKENKGVFDSLGPNCFLVICEGVDFPLNLPPAIMEEPVDEMTGVPASILTRTAWPIPFHAEPNGWPFTMLAFHRKPNYAWPISHIKPGIGELRLLNWGMSFLATRIATSCETLLAVQKAADQDLKDQILAPSEAGFKIVELSELLGRRIEDVLSVFQMPQVSRDLWDILTAVADLFAQRTGLSELVYGMTRNQFRSAAEAQIKQENISVRPDQMASELEDTMSMLARREALAARWLLEPEDVLPVLGPVGAAAWQQQVMPQQLADFTRSFQFRVEAGSARKPNKASRIEQMQMALQTLGPVLQQLIPMGVVDPFNALISDWAKSLDIDPASYLIPPPPPPPPPLPPGAMPPEALPTPQPDGESAPPGPPPLPPSPDAIPQELQP